MCASRAANLAGSVGSNQPSVGAHRHPVGASHSSRKRGNWQRLAPLSRVDGFRFVRCSGPIDRATALPVGPSHGVGARTRKRSLSSPHGISRGLLRGVQPESWSPRKGLERSNRTNCGWYIHACKDGRNCKSGTASFTIDNISATSSRGSGPRDLAAACPSGHSTGCRPARPCSHSNRT